MSNLFILNEAFTNGLNYNLLNIITFASIICGILVIISKNPVVSVLFSIGLFLNVAGYLIILAVYFMSMSYIIAFILTLFLFILVLYRVIHSSLSSNTSTAQGNSTVILKTVLSLFLGIFGLSHVLTSHPYGSVVTTYAFIFIIVTFVLGFYLIYPSYLRNIINTVFLNLEWCLNSPPKPHAFVNAPTQASTSIWITLFGAGPLLYMSTRGPIYANHAYRALDVQMQLPGCSVGDGTHLGKITSISILDRTWYGYEQCTFILHCTKCHLDASVGPVTSLFVKMCELSTVAGV